VCPHTSYIENFRQIHERVSDRLLDISPEYEQVQLNFHLTSVYDHSLHEAFSKVLHKLVDCLPYLEDLLNVFCAVRSMSLSLQFHLNNCVEFAVAESVLIRYEIEVIHCNRCVTSGFRYSQSLLRLSSNTELIWDVV